MESLYPFKFQPILQEKIWGGNKLVNNFNKPGDPAKKIGESWEVSGVPGFVSKVSNGILAGKDLNELIEDFGPELLGTEVSQNFDQFPLLIKFLDAAEDLSIQVHPNDEQARLKHHSPGKTEMWYILDADKGATLIDGFSKNTSKAEMIENLENGKLGSLLNQVPTQNQDVFYIPAGRVHTIGKGLLLAEIQQTSDITYRVYDFDRKDDEGNLRELHLDDAVEVLDFSECREPKTSYSPLENEFFNIVESEKFNTRGLNLSKPFSHYYSSKHSFRILIVTKGSGTLMTDGSKINISKGDTILLPASIQHIFLDVNNSLDLLESSIPKMK